MLKSWQQEYIDELVGMNWPELMELKRCHLPSSLFKYKFIDDNVKDENGDPYSISSLKSDTIWLSSPNKLNDPYDCSFDITDDDITKLGGALVSDYDIKIEEAFEKLESEGKSEVIVAMKKLFEHRHEKLINEFSTKAKDLYQKIFSLSERKDSILMWTHYAKDHTGFCIEYEASADLWDGQFLRCIHPVVYTDNLLDIGRYLTSTNRWEKFISFLLPALFKAKDWEYEKEWRLVYGYGILEKNILKAPPVKAIYAGSRISNPHRELLKEICDKKNIPLYAVNWKARQFNMSYECI